MRVAQAFIAWMVAGTTVALSSAHLPGEEAVRAIPVEVLERPVPLRGSIGIAREPLSTRSPKARAFYEQGLACLHSFAWIEAARSFHTALRHDPKMAMAHLGLSFAFGGLGSSQGAREALERARALAPTADARERLRIALRAQQLEMVARADDQTLIATYRAALDRALVSYPDDVELLLLRGQAEEAVTGSPMSSGPGAVAFYQRAIRVAPDQFAARHYLVHAYENAGRLELALAQAGLYVRMAPLVPHAHHMYAHAFRRTGRINEALDAFRKAEELELAYLKTENISPEFDWHYHHNESLLAAAYQSVGQMRAARERLRQIFDIPAPLIPEELAKRDWPSLLLASGSVNEALAAAERLVAHPVPLLRAAGHLAAARIHMSVGRMDRAGVEADAALRELRSAGPESGALAPDLRVVQGEFFLRSGDREKGRAMIREGVRQLRADNGPDGWSQTLFEIEALGRAARDVGDWALGAELADAMRQHDPFYAGSSYALGRVAEQRGDTTAAARFYRETLQRWSAADANHIDLVDARKRLANSPR